MNFYSIFSMELDGAEPSVRYFLVRYLWLYGDRAVPTKGVKLLAKEIGVTDKIVTRAIAFLVGNQYLARFDVLNDRRKPGRPKSKYVLSNKLIGLLRLDAAQNPVPVHLPLMKALMASNSVKERAHRTNSTRYFLCVLLSRADQFGVVAGAGSAELGRYTGLSDQQIKRYTADLIRESYLVACFKGFNSRSLSGRVTNTYVLNLCCSQHLKPDGYKLIISGSRYHNLLERVIEMSKVLQMMVGLKTISAEEFIDASNGLFDRFDLPRFDAKKFFVASEIISSWKGVPIGAFLERRIYDLTSELLTLLNSKGGSEEITDDLISEKVGLAFEDQLFPRSLVVINGVLAKKSVLFLISAIVREILNEIVPLLKEVQKEKASASSSEGNGFAKSKDTRQLVYIYPRYFGIDDACILIMNAEGFKYVSSS